MVPYFLLDDGNARHELMLESVRSETNNQSESYESCSFCFLCKRTCLESCLGRKLFNEDKAFEGYNATIFAYGSLNEFNGASAKLELSKR